jgi:hypothetical protein
MRPKHLADLTGNYLIAIEQPLQSLSKSKQLNPSFIQKSIYAADRFVTQRRHCRLFNIRA